MKTAFDEIAKSRVDIGSPTWARTRDLRINSPSLYQLSYQGTRNRSMIRARPTTVNAGEARRSLLNHLGYGIGDIPDIAGIQCGHTNPTGVDGIHRKFLAQPGHRRFGQP
jgi:hypothetical protein